ncbi:tetratricopeptide repeat protein [Plantactinospora sonchi]|uniref:Tetratricopeptide repeat protein n=1 Tax=Plantactinospora sonchi TaxID=1544735 RepID=A0ABU7RXN9_9ACTN
MNLSWPSGGWWRRDLGGAHAVGPGSVAIAGDNDGDIHIELRFEPPPSRLTWPCQVGTVPALADQWQSRIPDALLHSTSRRSRTVILSGLGGVGKTQTAAHYARSRLVAGDIGLLLWITASSRTAVITGYAAAAARVHQHHADDAEQAAQSLLTWLGTTERTWLVVLDDLAEPGIMRDLWPPSRQAGRTVVTTRRRDAALTRHGERSLVVVGAFSSYEAKQYILAKLSDVPDVASHVGSLVEQLEYLPLALAQASTYILDRELTCADYLRRLADERSTLAQLMPEPQSLPDDQVSPIAAAWSLSITAADELHPPGVARPLLEMVAFLDGHGVPTGLFNTPRCLHHLSVRSRTDVTAADVADGLRNLGRLSLADLHDAGATLRTHSLLQRAVRESTATTPEGECVPDVCADALREVWPAIERDPGHAQTLRANVAVLAERAGNHLWRDGAVSEVLVLAGQSLGVTGHALGARAYFADMAQRAVDLYGNNYSLTYFLRELQARWRGASGDASGAAAEYDALRIDLVNQYGHDDARTLATRAELIKWQMKSGTVVDLAAYAKLVRDFERVEGQDHASTLILRINLADLQRRAGDPAGAAAAAGKIIGDQRRILGEDDPAVIDARRLLTHCLADLGDLQGALAEARAVMADCLRIFGPIHETTLGQRASVAHYTGRCGQAREAAVLLEELVAETADALNDMHPTSLIIRRTAAEWIGEGGDWSKSVSLYEELHDAYKLVHGPQHPETIRVRLELGRAHSEAGDDSAASIVLEAVAVDTYQWLPAGNPDRLEARSIWASHLCGHGDPLRGAAELTRVAAEWVKHHGAHHANTVDSMKLLPLLPVPSDAAAELAEALRDAFQSQAALLPRNHPRMLAIRDRAQYWYRRAQSDA